MNHARVGGTVSRSLSRRRDDMLREIVETIQEEEPAYTRFPSARDEDEWVTTAAWLLDLFLQRAVAPRPFSTSERAAITHIGTTRHAQGFDFGATRAAVRAAAAVIRGHILQEYSHADDRDRSPMDRLLEHLKAFRNEIEELLEAGFVTAPRVRTNKKEQVSALLQDVVDGRVRRVEDLSARITELGCEPAGCALLLAAEPSAARRIGSSMPEAAVAHRAGGRSAHSLLVLPRSPSGWPSTSAHIREVVRLTEATVLVLGPGDDLADLYDRYVCALPLVPHLHRLGRDGEVLLDRDVELVMLVAALPTDVREAVVRRILTRPLAASHPTKTAQLLACLADHVELGFSAVAIQGRTGQNIKTVYEWRNQLARGVQRSLTEPGDQALLALAHHARRLG